MGFWPVDATGADYCKFPGADDIRTGVYTGMAYAAASSRGPNRDTAVRQKERDTYCYG